MTTKLSSLFFNARIQDADSLMSVYEFQTVDTGRAIRKTWVIWREESGIAADTAYLPARTDTVYKQNIQYTSSPESTILYPGINGKVMVLVDSFPVYYFEKKSAPLHRPDIIIDSFYIIPPSPVPGSYKFYVHLKNIGNDSLKSSIPDTITFYVNGTSIGKKGANRGLGPNGDTVTVGPYNWTTPSTGYRLCCAWVDNSDYYVELNDDNNRKYLYRYFDNGGTKSQTEENPAIPAFYFMNQSLPNPTPGKEVTIKYGLPQTSQVNFVVYNVAGQMVWEYNQLSQKPGYYALRWNLRDLFDRSLASGIYFYRLNAGFWTQTKKMIVIK
jgi:archaellum component FlaG (FlaF/FlaG flagellin family)